MFSDRFWGLKALLAAAAFVALCRGSDFRLRVDEPPVESVPLRGDSLRGRTVHVATKRVTASHPDWVEVRTSGGPVRLLGQSTPAARPGDVLSATGTVTGRAEIRAVRLRVHAGYDWKRPLNYAISVLTLVVFAAWAAPLFRGRLRDLRLWSRH